MAKEMKVLSTEYNILLALEDNHPRHGYGIMKEVLFLTDGRTKIPTGTLYRSIEKLLDAGLIEQVNAPPQKDNKTRIYYKITGLGQKTAKSQIDNQKSFFDRLLGREKLLGGSYG